MRFWKVLLTAAWLCACTATPEGYIDHGKLAQLTPGTTTYDQVVASWGPPASTSTLPDGGRVAVYPYVWLVTGPVTSVAGVGPVGSTDTRTGELALTFDRAGVLQSYREPR
jgi:hypothetical protein